MLVDISNIIKTKGSKDFSFNEPLMDIEDSVKLEFREDPVVTGTVTADEHEALVKGHLSGVIKEKCSRCLDDIEYPLEVDFEGTFAEKENLQEDIYGYTSSVIIIDRMVLDAISLELPGQYLCREDCKGLCPKCGVNRNREKCNCDTLPDENNPFAKLKDLF